MRIIFSLCTLLIVAGSVSAQNSLPVIKSASDTVTIKDGDFVERERWILKPAVGPYIYQSSVSKGKKKKVTFATDIDSISFDVEAGKIYEFVVQKGDRTFPAQIKATLLDFWNDKDFWESPALKTPFNPNISNTEKIAGLAKFWSEAKYNFINFHLVPDLDWDKTYLEFIPKVLATRSTLEYYRVLQMFCSRLKDGHTNVYLPSELADEVLRRPAIVTQLVEDRVIILRILDEKLRNQGLKVGQEITEIDGIPVKKYAAEKVLTYASESTQQAFETRVYQFDLLNGALTRPIELTIKDDEANVFKRILPRLSLTDRNKLVIPRPAFELKLLPNNIAHVKVNTMDDGSRADQLFADNFVDIAKADAVILDLRENGGGHSNVGYRILSFLVDQSFKGSKWFTREYHPSFRPWNRPEKTFGDENATEYDLDAVRKWRGQDVKPFLRPVIVLSSPRTGSAAEDFLVAFKPLKRGLIIGEPTNGSTGQPLTISLPGGGSARICSKYDTFPDGTAFVGVGVTPDILAKPKISDFRNNQDSILDVALKEIEKTLKKVDKK